MAELQPPEGQINGGALVMASTENVGTERQRRPSVRLSDIGDQPYDSHLNRRTKQWKMPVKDSSKASKTRPLMNFSAAGNYQEVLEGEDKEGNLDGVAIGSWKARGSKSKRGSTSKRLRSSWVSKVNEGQEKFSGGEDVDEGIRDFDHEGSESPLKEQNPIHLFDNMATDTDRGHGNEREANYHGHRRGVRFRVSEGREHHEGVELDGPSDTDARNWNSSERNGVRVWLDQFGLGQYAPVFEIHEVLPMLTLEDLEDMGINAVGSRRKMYCSIQNLGEGFSRVVLV